MKKSILKATVSLNVVVDVDVLVNVAVIGFPLLQGQKVVKNHISRFRNTCTSNVHGYAWRRD